MSLFPLEVAALCGPLSVVRRTQVRRGVWLEHPRQRLQKAAWRILATWNGQRRSQSCDPCEFTTLASFSASGASFIAGCSCAAVAFLPRADCASRVAIGNVRLHAHHTA